MFKVFISHSVRDQRLVIILANILSKFGIDVSVAEWYLDPNQRLNKKVLDKIENSDCVIALLTQNGIRSNWVQQEIEYALKSKKLLIPLIEKGITDEYLEALKKRSYIKYDPYNPQQALIEVSAYVTSLKLKREERERTLLIAGCILVFLLILLSFKEKK